MRRLPQTTPDPGADSREHRKERQPIFFPTARTKGEGDGRSLSLVDSAALDYARSLQPRFASSAGDSRGSRGRLDKRIRLRLLYPDEQNYPSLLCITRLRMRNNGQESHG